MKKSLVLMLAVILVTSLFAGCGQGAAKLPRMQFYTMHADRNPT